MCRLNWPRRDTAPLVILLYGESGVGKTRLVNDKYPVGIQCFRKAPDSKWFDGYDAHNVLLLDDFAGAASKMSLSYVLQLLDRYEISVEVKGDSVPLLAKIIFITTNIHPHLWYKWENRKIQYKALTRRIHHVIGFDGHGSARILNSASFFGKLTEVYFGDYSSSNCEWMEQYSISSVSSIPFVDYE